MVKMQQTYKEDKGRHPIVSEMLQTVNGVKEFTSIQKIIS